MNIVDSQVHIWGPDTPQRPWPPGRAKEAQKPYPISQETLLFQMDLAGVRRMVLVPPSWEGDRNDLALAAAQQYPDRFAVMGRLALRDPGQPRAGRRLEEAAGHARHALHLPQRAQPAVPHRRLGRLAVAGGGAGRRPADGADAERARHPGPDRGGASRPAAGHRPRRARPSQAELLGRPAGHLRAGQAPQRRAQGLGHAVALDGRLSVPRSAFAHPHAWWTPSDRSGRSGAPTSRACPAPTTSASRSSPSTCRGSRARISSGSWAAASASGSAGPCPRRDRHEIHLVQPDAVAVPAGRLPGEEPLGVGGHPQHALRPAQGSRRLSHVSRSARVRRDAGLRRHRVQRASPERLRADAVAESDRRRRCRAGRRGRRCA